MKLKISNKIDNYTILVLTISFFLSSLALILSPIISPDYYFYERDFYDFLQKSDSQDLTYETLKRFFRLFTSFDLFYFIMINTIVYFKIKLFKHFSVSYIYFLPFYIFSFYILHDLIQFRLSLGLVLFLYSIFLYENKLYIKALLIFVSSILAHNSIVILLLPIIVSQFSYKSIIIFLAVSSLIFFNTDFESLYEFISQNNLIELSSKNADYFFELSKINFKPFISKLALVFLLNIILLKFIFHKYTIKSDLIRFEKFVVISFSFGVFFLSIFSENMVLANRIFELLIFYFPLIQGLCFYHLFKRSQVISIMYLFSQILINFILFTNQLL